MDGRSRLPQDRLFGGPAGGEEDAKGRERNGLAGDAILKECSILSGPFHLSVMRRVVSVLTVVAVLGPVLGSPVAAQDRLSPGDPLPSIESSLQRLDGTETSPKTLVGEKGTAFLFWSNRCPWVDKYEERVQALVSAFQDQGIRFVLVNANDASRWPAESLEASRKHAKEDGYEAVYVHDPDGSFARALGATRTPQVFLFDRQQTLAYVGAIDDSPGIPEQVETAYLRNAIEAVLAGKSVPTPENEALGCTLKYAE
jgi:thiol-disulfide isomerase/thioredoxin